MEFLTLLRHQIAVRALGRGFRVAFGQFMKRPDQAGEQEMLARLLGENFLASGAGFYRDRADYALHRRKALEPLGTSGCSRRSKRK